MISYTLVKALLAFLMTLLPLVFIHELGHYLVARWFGVHVESFSIGFGPRLVSWTDRHHTVWQIAALPLGGYVKIAQECTIAPPTQVEQESLRHFAEGPVFVKTGMASKTPLQRILIALGGPAANYLTAFCILMPALMLIGVPQTPPLLAQPGENTVASAQIQQGDRILAVNDRPVSSIEEVRALLVQTPLNQSPLVLTLQRQAATVKAVFSAQDVLRPKGELASLEGVSWAQTLTGLKTSVQALQARTYHPKPVAEALAITGQMMDPVTPLLQLTLKNLGGPVMIAQQASTAVDAGWQTVVFFIAQISIALGFFNLLPLPGLDGGMVVLTALEGIRGRPLSERTQSLISVVALLSLASLFLVLTWQDLMRIPLVVKAVSWATGGA